MLQISNSIPKTLKPSSCDYLLTDTVVIFLCGPEANDGVGDCGSIDGGEASYDRKDHSILDAVVAWDTKRRQKIQDILCLRIAIIFVVKGINVYV